MSKHSSTSQYQKMNEGTPLRLEKRFSPNWKQQKPPNAFPLTENNKKPRTSSFGKKTCKLHRAPTKKLEMASSSFEKTVSDKAFPFSLPLTIFRQEIVLSQIIQSNTWNLWFPGKLTGRRWVFPVSCSVVLVTAATSWLLLVAAGVWLTGTRVPGGEPHWHFCWFSKSESWQCCQCCRHPFPGVQRTE